MTDRWRPFQDAIFVFSHIDVWILAANLRMANERRSSEARSGAALSQVRAMGDHDPIVWVGKEGGLRLANLAGDSVLSEITFPEAHIDETTVRLVGTQLQSVVEEMRREWDANPDSPELGRSFDLLIRYVQCLNI